MKPRNLILFTLLAASALAADVNQGKALVMEGKPAEALDILRGDTSAAAAFWRGRALIHLKRFQEAALALHQVPEEHELYPYAAKALLYCAWRSKEVDFAVIATPLTTSRNPEIAALATAALAEHWLHQPRSHDNAALARLRQLVKAQPELQPLLDLLEIDNLRLRGEYDKAAEQCRTMENDRKLPLIMRQRVRLSLAEVYYTKEANNPQQTGKEKPAPDRQLSLLSTDDSSALTSYDDGKGEETLLHFISSNPESPLLEEAFRRLHEHGAFTESEYAQAKLQEWIAEPLKSRRASLALLVQQHLLMPENAHDITPDVTCANTAAATCPHEPATRTILLEQTRWYLERKQPHEAMLYLSMIQGNDVYRSFYENQLHSPAAEGTAHSYLSCAREAPDNLRKTALINALISALKSGDTATQEAVLNMPDLSETLHYELLLTRAAYWLDKDTEKAQADIDMLLSHPAPNLDFAADVEMNQVYLHLKNNPEKARELLQKSKINDHLTRLSDDRQLRFFALNEETLRRLSSTNDEINANREALEMIQLAAGKVHSPKVVAILTLHKACLQSALGQHVEARRTLNVLQRKYPKGDFASRALYMSARESELIGTADALKLAIELYNSCASFNDELCAKATIRRAAVMLRLGQIEESEHVLVGLLRQKRTTLRKEEIIMANAILANNQAMLGTEEGRLKAVEIVEQTLADTTIPRLWRFRVLLHHATLCARAEQYEKALRDYEEILSMNPATGKTPSRSEWHILYSAGSGAVMQLLYLTRYGEAAAMAEKIGEWNAEHADLTKQQQFSNWAQYIRQTNFVDKSDLLF
jgi:tetratricopeptide (TPR) repeat protein